MDGWVDVYDGDDVPILIATMLCNDDMIEIYITYQ